LENDLIIKAQADDRAAFETLVLHYRPHATRFAASLLHNEHDAEDMAQESFARVWLGLSGFNPGISFKSWLFTIVHHRCIDHLRGKKMADSFPDDWNPPGGPEPQAALEDKERWQTFARQYRQLPGDARMALYLFAAEGLSYKDIALVTGKSTVAVKTLIYRTRKTLRQKGARP
jgi:RNA polymerase sigma-70 factor (ECF subfamily)